MSGGDSQEEGGDTAPTAEVPAAWVDETSRDGPCRGEGRQGWTVEAAKQRGPQSCLLDSAGQFKSSPITHRGTYLGLT